MAGLQMNREGFYAESSRNQTSHNYLWQVNNRKLRNGVLVSGILAVDAPQDSPKPNGVFSSSFSSTAAVLCYLPLLYLSSTNSGRQDPVELGSQGI